MDANKLAECLPKDSWFREWLGLWPASECPKPYLLFAAMSMMGAALGRRIWNGSKEERPLWPMLNLLLIGPSGIGKSTAILLSRKLLGGLPKLEQPQFIIGGSTQERLHADLVPNPHAVLFASELANFFNRQKYNEALVPYVTELLDYEPVEKRTQSGGVLRIEEPSVTVVGGSTVEWLQEQLPDAAVAGGFLARFLIVEERHKSQRIADPDTALTKTQRTELERKRPDVLSGFHHCVLAAGGQMRFRDFGVSDTYGEWYSSHKPISGFLAPFAARAPEFIKRMAMILAASALRPDIAEPDMLAAIELYSYIETKLQQVVVPYTPQGKLMKMVLDCIGQDVMSEQAVYQGMMNFAGVQEIQKHLWGLITAGLLTRTEEGKLKRTNV